MSKFILDYWYLNNNSLNILLSKYYIEIKECVDNSYMFYELSVFQRNEKQDAFKFNTLEEAVRFTEDKIIFCNSINEINNVYRYNSKIKKMLKENKKTTN